jgi:hypothetical protein
LAVTQVEIEHDSAVTGALETRRPRNRKRWVIGALVLAVLAATLGFLSGNEIQANTQFDQTHYSLNVTTHRLDTELAELGTVRHELEVVNGQVSADSAVLTQERTQLQGAQNVLTKAQAAVSDQTAAIGDLQACLGGVEQALNALAVSDQGRAIDALDATSNSCAEAVAADG